MASLDLSSCKLLGVLVRQHQYKTRAKFGNDKIRAAEPAVGNAAVVMAMLLWAAARSALWSMIGEGRSI